VHLAPPGSIEAYYQEVGRAGRDGAEAIGLLLHAPADMALRRRLLEGGEPPPAPAVVEHKWSLFLELMRWAEGGSCRHDAILRYFGDDAEALAGCGKCDVCRDLGSEAADDEETTLVVRKALSAVARVHHRYGLTAAVKLLAGLPDPRLERAGLDRTPTFGALKGRSDEWLTRVLRRCVTAGWVDFTPGDRPVVLLTGSGRAVMKGERPARLVLPREHGAGLLLTAAPKASGGPTARKGSGGLPPEAAARFETLRRLRLELARRDGVPPFVVASDRTLRDVAVLRPRTLDELQQAYGIGAAKAERYGARLLEAIAERDPP
jgi:ATP-dependent DNA helicase RecQ